MFKLVQSGKTIGGIVTSAIAAGQPLKIIKTVSAGGHEQQQGQQQQSSQQVGLFWFVFLSKKNRRFRFQHQLGLVKVAEWQLSIVFSWVWNPGAGIVA